MSKSNPLRTWPGAIGAAISFAWLISVTWAFAAQRPDQAAELFRQKVLPIFEQNCVACHGGTIQRFGLDLRTQETILRGGSRGPAVVPGRPDQSLLYRLVSHTDAPAMPMGKPRLADSDIAAIAQWIRSLSRSASAVASEATVPVRKPGYEITDKDRHFWSFLKPVRPDIPATANRSQVRGAIDAFVLRRLEENGLAPAPAAEPRTLIRRVYLDLIGLPPSPEEVDRFLKDPSDAAYEKVIDELLASPHYGQRWGRHWLDLARYADSGGYEFDYDRPNAWRYRDYVIKAFNDDKPYLQFIREQLAGDQLKPNDAEFLVPTGFCRSGPTVDNADNEETRMDELDDMVTTTSSVFLGLTVGCARCHDHKYDPIPQKDYYRMQAIFSPFKKTDQSLLSPGDEAAFKARAKAFDEELKPLKQKVAVIEKPHRERLLADKVDFHLKLAQSTGSLEGQDPVEYRKALVERFGKDVKLQPEEIEALLSAEEKQARKSLLNEIEKVDRMRSKPLPAAMGITDDEKLGKTFLLERGNYRQKGEEVQPGLPSVLAGGTDLSPKDRRRQLADWIASADNPLTARVVVNRIWQYHFGRGIVRTPSDFGATGDRPSHPELLDWLATEMIARGWSWKAMHRLILTSNTYRQSSRFDSKAAAKDPENRLLWRMSPRRVETETLRDSILTISGKLNHEMGGPGVYPRIDPSVIATGSRPKWPLDVREGPGEWRRSVYIFVKRSVLVPLIEVFDCPVTTVSAPLRSVSTVSPQALALMNNEFVLEQAGYFAERVKREAGVDTRAQIARAFWIALSRGPNAKETTWASDFLKSQSRGYSQRKSGDPDGSALRDFCHALINLSEFLYVD
jgi:mono/diheme cytochrome c family protein